MTKRLWLSEGITDKTYILEDLKKSKFNYQSFDEIYVFPNEKYLSQWTLDIPIWNRFGDILRYCFNPIRLKRVREGALEMFHSVDRQPGDFDLAIGHSLGTLALLALPAYFDVIFTCGCPLGFPTWPVLGARWYIEWFTERLQNSGECVKVRKWLNFFGEYDDIVSKIPIGSKWFQRAALRMNTELIFDSGKFFQFKTETSHDFSEYASAMNWFL